MSDHLPKVCIIGAGPSGLVATKILSERGIPFKCFEKGSAVGGLWRFNNDSGTSAAYESLHINSSRQLMAFSGFPMKPTLPDFPHHSDILGYLEDYSSHFGLDEKINFRTEVKSVEPHADSDGTGTMNAGYDVTTQSRDGSKAKEHFDAVIVANGHHWSPKQPQFEGEFDGEWIHSHHYKSAKAYEGKSVLVVGIGNSGVDIACEVSRVAEKTVLSTRRGAHVIPKYILGKPVDRVASPKFWTYCPHWIRQKLFTILLKLTRGRQSRYGLPEPDYKVLEEHPTVSSELLNLLGHGKIKVKPNIQKRDGDRIHFADGTSETFDTVILATGYNIRFPFLSPEVIETRDNQVSLFKKVVHPQQPGLYFVGLVQPWGPLMPLAEAQAEWIGDLLQDKARLPGVREMNQSIEKERQAIARRYVESTRHTIQVDFYPYLKDIHKQRKKRKGTKALTPLRSNAILLSQKAA